MRVRSATVVILSCGTESSLCIEDDFQEPENFIQWSSELRQEYSQVGWWACNTACRWCITELWAWNLYHFVNQCHPNKLKKQIKEALYNPPKEYIIKDDFKVLSIKVISSQTLDFHLQKTHCCPGWCGSVDWVQAVNQRVASSIPCQGTCLGCRPGPQ